MMLPLLVSLAVPLQGTISPASPPRSPARVTVRLSDSSFAHGQRARVYVELRDTAYLLVLHVNGHGRIRVLFPLRPIEGALVPGGEWYEIPGLDGRAAIGMEEREGTGTVLAACSRIPFQSSLLARGDDWDYTEALLFQPTGGEPLAAALDIVERLADGRRTEVDVTTYAVTSPAGMTSHVPASGATAEPTAIWQSVRSRPYPGARGNPSQGESAYGDSNVPAPIIINAVCANSYVSEGAVCGSVLFNPTFVQSEPENQPYSDAVSAGGYYPYYDPFFFLLFSRRLRMIERPAPPPPPLQARALPRPPRPSQVRVIKPALAQALPLPLPRRPTPVAAIGARIRAPASGDVPPMAAARPPVISVTRRMPAAWSIRRPVTAIGAAASAATARATPTPVVRPMAGSTTVTSGVRVEVGTRAASQGTTRIITRVPTGVSMGARPPATRRPASAAPAAAPTSAQAYRRPTRPIRPRTP